jgi:hypothetical protein
MFTKIKKLDNVKLRKFAAKTSVEIFRGNLPNSSTIEERRKNNCLPIKIRRRAGVRSDSR